MGASNHLLRLTTADYSDGLSEMNMGTDPVAISRVIFDQEGDMPNDQGLSTIFTFWGQFLDHDLSLTPDHTGEMVFVPGLVAPLQRSSYDRATGITDAREQINVITPEIDASMLYGSDLATETVLRSFEGGLLSMTADGLLETTTTGMAGASEEHPLFMSGDVRANENTGLTMLHTLFSAEHNHWANRIAASDASLSDQEIFEMARSILEYEVQKITYEDWMPHLIGDALAADTGYDASVDGQISTEFSTAAFRFGHTMVTSLIPQTEEDGSTSDMGDVTVQQSFFNNAPILANGIDDLLRGQAEEMAQQSDATIIDDLNFFLESPDGVSGFSLAALNVLRARDHGLGTYVDVRAELLGDIDLATLDLTDFSIITQDLDTQARLIEVYGTVDKVDLWVGGLAEDNLAGTQLGPLFTHIVADQFERTRAADETFGELDARLDPAIRADVLSQSSLSDIVLRSSGVEYVQENIFEAANRIGGDEGNDYLRGTRENDLILGFDGNDLLKGGKGDDAIFGGDGRDCLKGNRGDDTIEGGAGRDHVMGNWGDDVLNGGTGRDFLRGGYGDDTFIFEAGSGQDVIKDFVNGNDLIELAGFGFDDFSDVLDVAHQTWKGVVLDFDQNDGQAGGLFTGYNKWSGFWGRKDDGDTLTLNGVSLWQLSEEDFSFA